MYNMCHQQGKKIPATALEFCGCIKNTKSTVYSPTIGIRKQLYCQV